MAAPGEPARHPFLRDPPHFIAHRGGAGLAPENTLTAFRSAADDWRADMIELDVRASSDGHCVVVHDETVDRTTDGSGAVASMTLGQLRQLDAGYRFSPDGGASHPFRGMGLGMPTFEEVLEALPRARFIVEVKAGAAQIPLFDAIERHGARDRVMAAAAHDRDRTLFDDYAGPVSASGDSMKRMYVLHRLHGIRFWREGRAQAVQLPLEHRGRRMVNRRLVQELRQRDLVVHVWTVDDEEDMHTLFDWGVHGILSDRPDRLARVMAERFGRPLPPAAGGGGSRDPTPGAG